MYTDLYKMPQTPNTPTETELLANKLVLETIIYKQQLYIRALEETLQELADKQVLPKNNLKEKTKKQSA